MWGRGYWGTRGGMGLAAGNVGAGVVKEVSPGSAWGKGFLGNHGDVRLAADSVGAGAIKQLSSGSRWGRDGGLLMNEGMWVGQPAIRAGGVIKQLSSGSRCGERSDERVLLWAGRGAAADRWVSKVALLGVSICGVTWHGVTCCYALVHAFGGGGMTQQGVVEHAGWWQGC